MFPLFLVELRRKAFHATGSLIPIVYYFLSRETAVIGLSAINAVLLLIEWLRLNDKIKLPEILLRPHENKKVAAYIYFQIAALISILAFEKTIAIAAILMLALGDAASGLAGTVITGGNVRDQNARKLAFKPLPIIAVMFGICVLIGLVLLSLPPAPDMIHVPFHAYAAGAIGAALGDAIPVRILGRSIDDNLIIPLVSGLFMTAVMWLF